MEKENKLKAEQETKDTEIVELNNEDMSTISGDSENQNPLKSDSYVGYEIFFY